MLSFSRLRTPLIDIKRFGYNKFRLKWTDFNGNADKTSLELFGRFIKNRNVKVCLRTTLYSLSIRQTIIRTLSSDDGVGHLPLWRPSWACRLWRVRGTLGISGSSWWSIRSLRKSSVWKACRRWTIRVGNDRNDPSSLVNSETGTRNHEQQLVSNRYIGLEF